MTVYEIDLETHEFLKQRAEKFGEDLNQAWFDPFFWHPKEMKHLKSQIKKKHEYRGLMCDDISFMEIRRKGKHRKKYLVKELLGESQLFPMVNVVDLSVRPSSIRCVIIEMVLATGSIAKYGNALKKPFTISELRLARFSSNVGVFFLYSQPTISGFKMNKDDFLVRGQSVTWIYPKSNNQSHGSE